MNDIVTVDASGLSCPQPVLETKKALSKLEAGRVEVLVDTATSRDNVARFGANKGWSVEKQATENGYRVLLSK